MKGWCRSISNHSLEERRQSVSKTTLSIISGDTMYVTTSTSIVAVDMGMQRSAVTAPTAADVTTATGPDGPRTTGTPRVQQSDP